MVLWQGPRPQFGRWTYWEKFDYFAVFWGVAIIGFSGLIMWFPTFFTRFMPGWVINIALIVHSDEALLAAGFIFSIHFFNTHFRIEKFPMDTVIFSGRISKTEMLHERKRWLDRLVAEGGLEGHRVKDEWERWKNIARGFGYFFFGLGSSCWCSSFMQWRPGWSTDPRRRRTVAGKFYEREIVAGRASHDGNHGAARLGGRRSRAEALKDSDCLDCHKDRTLTTTNAAGREISLFVDTVKLQASVHKTNTCVSCHADVTAKHPDDNCRPKPSTAPAATRSSLKRTMQASTGWPAGRVN